MDGQGPGSRIRRRPRPPPSSTWEIINPREFEKAKIPVVPLLPDIHPLLDKQYKPYDIGQVGELDLHILTQLFGGDAAARDLTPAWDGGIYWAGQQRNAAPADQASTKSVVFFYLSSWKSDASAMAFAKLYTNSLGRKYSGLHPDDKATHPAPADSPSGPMVEKVFATDEGPVVITTRGKQVFVAESFDLSTARKLTALILDSQVNGELKMASLQHPASTTPQTATIAVPSTTLSGGLVHLFATSGVMKSAVEAGIKAAAYKTPN